MAAGVALWSIPTSTPVVGHPPLWIGWVFVVLGVGLAAITTLVHLRLVRQELDARGFRPWPWPKRSARAVQSNVLASHSVGNRPLESWVRQEVARHAFTEIAGARGALYSAVTYSIEPLDWPWSVSGGLLRRGAYGITHVEGDINDPTVIAYQQRFNASVEDGREQFRTDGFDVVVRVADRMVYLAVTNRGSHATFMCQLARVEGVRENVPTPLNLRWRGSEGDFRPLGPDETQLVEVAEGDGMGDRKDLPGMWTFRDVSGPLPTHIGPLGGWDELYEKEITVVALVRRQDTGRTKLKTMRFGFANELLTSTSGDRNLTLRVREA